MANTIKAELTGSHRVNGESPKRMVRADLPKRENDDLQAHIGSCLDDARRALGWTVDRLARELGKDDKQIARWMRGEERTQVDVVFNVPQLRQPFVIALAKLARCEVITEIRVRTA